MKPIVQCITNIVTVNDCANVVLATKASPIMAHHIKEVSEVQEFSKALLLNLGATDDYDAMEIALSKAIEMQHPVVLDPVGVAGISFRREFALRLLDTDGISCIRGNYNEVNALIDNQKTGCGLDYDKNSDGSSVKEDDISSFAGKIQQYAKAKGIIVVASGKTDIVSDGERVSFIENGDEMMSCITGSGCMASAVVASALAFEKSTDSVIKAMKIYGECGQNAAKKTREANGGIGTFHRYFLDELSCARWHE